MLKYWVFIISIPLGFYLAAHFLHYKKKYFWFEYLAIFIIPTAALFFIFKSSGIEVIVFFLAFCVIGPIAEATVGNTYLSIRGKHLWLYEKFPLFNRTTSYLSIPFWGFISTGVYSIEKIISQMVK